MARTITIDLDTMEMTSTAETLGNSETLTAGIGIILTSLKHTAASQGWDEANRIGGEVCALIGQLVDDAQRD